MTTHVVKNRWVIQGLVKRHKKPWYLFRYRFTDKDNRTVVVKSVIRDIFGFKRYFYITLNDEKGVIDCKVYKVLNMRHPSHRELQRRAWFKRRFGTRVKELLKLGKTEKEIEELIKKEIETGHCHKPANRSIKSAIRCYKKLWLAEIEKDLNRFERLSKHLRK